jgi:hypothetical protein
MAYSFGGSCIILFIINLIPGLRLRSREDEEIMGIDDAEIGEFAVCSFFQNLRVDIPHPNFSLTKFHSMTMSKSREMSSMESSLSLVIRHLLLLPNTP